MPNWPLRVSALARNTRPSRKPWAGSWMPRSRWPTWVLPERPSSRRWVGVSPADATPPRTRGRPSPASEHLANDNGKGRSGQLETLDRGEGLLPVADGFDAESIHSDDRAHRDRDGVQRPNAAPRRDGHQYDRRNEHGPDHRDSNQRLPAADRSQQRRSLVSGGWLCLQEDTSSVIE